jgi:hypothetical protein
LVIGTMVPDLSGYYPALLDYRATHSLIGVITRCMPIGVMLYYIYQAFLKRPFFDLFPDAVTSRMRPWIDRSIKLTPSAILIVAGAAVYYFNERTVNPYSNWISVLTGAVKGGVACAFALFLLYSLGMNLLWWRDRIRPPHLSDEIHSAD